MFSTNTETEPEDDETEIEYIGITPAYLIDAIEEELEVELDA